MSLHEDQHAWEHSKENVAPVKKGRSVTKINAVLRQMAQDPLGDGAVAGKLDREKKEWEQRVTVALQEEEDPLPIWISYLQWIEETNLSDTNKLLNALEQCCRQFQDDPRFTNDMRYLRIWLGYSDMVDNPIDNYKHMKARGIGLSHAIFWESWALQAEAVSDNRTAQEVYDEAIRSRAQPHQRILNAQEAFQRRLMNKIKLDTEQGTTTVRPSQRPGRTALASLGFQRGNDGTQTPMVQSIRQARAIGGVQQNMPSAGFAIFDDENAPPSARSQSKPAMVPGHLPSARLASKENAPAVSRMAGQRVELSRGVRNPATERPDFTLYEEERPAAQIDKPLHQRKQQANKALQPVRGAEGSGDLARNPLGRMRATEPTKSVLKTSYDVSLLRDALSGIEKTFEMHRAKAWITKNGPIPNKPTQEGVIPAKSILKETVEDEADSDNAMSMTDVHVVPPAAEQLAFKPAPKVMRSPVPVHAAPVRTQLSDDDDDYTAEPTATIASPTINTKAALADVYSMFSEDLAEPTEEITLSNAQDRFEAAMRSSGQIAAVTSTVAPAATRSTVQDDGDDFAIFEDDAEAGSKKCSNELQHETVERSTFSSGVDHGLSPIIESNSETDSIGQRQQQQRMGISQQIMEAVTEEKTGEVEASHAASSDPSPVVVKESPQPKGALIPIFTKEEQQRAVDRIMDDVELLPSFSDISECEGPPLPTFNNNTGRIVTRANCPITIGGEIYHPTALLGEGAFARVYLVTKASEKDAERTGWFKIEDLNRSVFALKVQKPPCPWEFYAMHTVHQRLKSCGTSKATAAQRWYVDPEVCTLHEDGSYLAMEYHSHGSLLDAINVHYHGAASTSASSMDEMLAAYYTVELLRALHTLHSDVQMFHGDVKSDNVLIRDVDAYDSTWEDAPEDEEIWPTPGMIVFIDFGRCIDLKLYGPHDHFTGSCETEGMECVEMREGRPWRRQVDTYGLAGIIYQLLFGKEMEIVHDANSGAWRPRENLKRYHQGKEIWKDLMHSLLNETDPDLLGYASRLYGFMRDPSQRGRVHQLRSLFARERGAIQDSR
eukprot:Clim_evm26s2 gene=Clim_evmTU26s2